MAHNSRYTQAKKTTLIGAALNALLGVVKLFGGIVYHSHALIADGIHSFSDLLTDIMVLLASKYGSLDADATHPYGHQRIETVAILLLSLFLMVAGLGIAWDAAYHLYQHTGVRPDIPSLPIICISILVNEVLFHYTCYIGKKISSPLIMANAWHHRSDAAASIVVLLGVAGSFIGFPALDAIAAIVVGLMIVKIGGNYAWNSMKELVDTGVEPKLFAHIEDLIQNTPGVQKIHQLRTRFMGSNVLVDVHILVEPQISVSEGHYIAQHVHHALVSQIDYVSDVIVHVDPEDDEAYSPSLNLPNREQVQDKWLKHIQAEFPQILGWNLHYPAGKMIIDITCATDFTLWEELHQQIISHFKPRDHIQEVRLFRLQECIQHQ